MSTSYRRSPIALAVLALLYEAPMHHYRMQQLVKERGKDEVINVRQRASLYQTIERLLRAGLIQVRATQRAEKFPERTVYELSEEGRTTVMVWMQEMLSTPAQEFPEFPAALAHLPLLTPEDVQQQLEKRAVVLAAEIARIDAALSDVAQELPRLFLLEMEYLRTMHNSELAWVRTLIDELRSGVITWNAEWLAAAEAVPSSANEEK